jgi:xylan 1,4-beta-xylosidase
MVKTLLPYRRILMSTVFLSMIVPQCIVALPHDAPKKIPDDRFSHKGNHAVCSLTIDAVGNGTTFPPPGVYQFRKGTKVTLVAQPQKGSWSRGWSGDLPGMKNGPLEGEGHGKKSVSVIMDQSRSVTALFTQANWPKGPATTYDNPILPGDRPDLNIFSEGKDFYIIGSNFAMFPALEILHSTDLIHWERFARAIDASQVALDGQLGPGQGTWGAFITKYPGGYRLYFAINATQWFAEAENLRCPWSQPVKVKSVPVSPDGGVTYFDRGTGSDNSVFIDSDGTTYMVTKNGLGKWAGNTAVSDFGMNRLIAIDSVTGQLIPESMINLDFVNFDKEKGGGGSLTDPDWGHWAEGPTMVKRGEWYYYFVQTHTACTGKMSAWASKTLDGDPQNWSWLGYLMGPGDPYNGTQHPSAPFQIADGSWWVFAHSYDCTDNLSTPEHHGEWMGLAREGLLHQVTWADSTVEGRSIPVPRFTTAKNNLPAPALAQSRTPFLIPVSDCFSKPILGPAWTTYARNIEKFSVTDRPGWLRIKPDTATAWLLQKEALRATASVTKVEFVPSNDGEAAGICVRNGFWDDTQLLSGPTWIEGEGHLVGSFDVSVARAMENGKDVVRFAFRSRTPVATGGSGSYTALAEPVVVSYTVAAPGTKTVWLKLVRNNHMATGWYRTDRSTWQQIGEPINIKALDNNYGMSNAWIGNQAGLFARGKSADFDQYTYRDGFTDIPATATDQQSGTVIVTSDSKGKVLGELENGDWALYGSVDLGSSGTVTRSVRIEASSVGGGYVEFWLDPLANGPHFGPFHIDDTGDWEKWKTFSGTMNATGTHDVYLKVVGKPGTSLRVASLRFVQ